VTDGIKPFFFILIHAPGTSLICKEVSTFHPPPHRLNFSPGYANNSL
jgi:hypothetical protein